MYWAYDENPPCGHEERPDFSRCEWCQVVLLPENMEAWEVYARVYDQGIPDGFGGGPLNVLAVYETMDRMGIDKDRQMEMLDLVRRARAKVMERVAGK